MIAEPQSPPREIISLLCEILAAEMQNIDGSPFAQDQVRAYNQKASIPEDERPYIVVAFRRSRLIGARKGYESIAGSDGGSLIELQSQTKLETYTISLLCSAGDSRVLKDGILFALRSDFAESMQETQAFKIGDLPEDFVDASAAEASAILNRYDISFNVTAQSLRQRSVPFFDSFQKTIGVNINQ